MPLALAVGLLILLLASLATNLAQLAGRIDVPPDVPLVAGAPIATDPEAAMDTGPVSPAVLPLHTHPTDEEPIFW